MSNIREIVMLTTFYDIPTMGERRAMKFSADKIVAPDDRHRSSNGDVRAKIFNNSPFLPSCVYLDVDIFGYYY